MLSPVVVVVVVVVQGSGSFVLSAWAVRLAVISVSCNVARKSLDILEKGYNMYHPEVVSSWRNRTSRGW